MEMTAQCSLVIKIRNRTQRKYKTSLCHSNLLCAWIFSIIYSTFSAITQDTGQVGTAKERAKEILEKNISEQGMIGIIDRQVFSVEKRWLKTEGNPYVWNHEWWRKGREVTLLVFTDSSNTRTDKYQSELNRYLFYATCI